MYCPKCGNKLYDGARFCGRCGARIDGAGDGTGNEIARNAAANSGEAPHKNHGNRGGHHKAVIIAAVGVIAVAATAAAIFFGVKWNREKQYKAYLEAGLSYLEEEKWDDALTEFDEARNIFPKRVMPYRGIAKAYGGLDEKEHQEETYTAARAVIVQCYAEEKKLPDDSCDLYIDALSYYAVECDFSGADECSEEILSMLPESTDVNDESADGEVSSLSEEGGEANDWESLKSLMDEIEQTRLMYTAYYEVLENYQQQWGEGAVKESGIFEYLTGLCFARLVDFDGDGAEELMLVYTKEKSLSDESTYCMEILKYKDGSAECIYNNDLYSHEYGSVFYMTQIEDIYYLLYNTSDGYIQYDELYGCKDGEFQLLHMLFYEGWDGTSGTYTMDDKEVDAETYNNERDKWYENRVEYALSVYSDIGGCEDTLKYATDTIDFLREAVGDEDTGESVENNQYLSAYQDVVDEYVSTYGKFNKTQSATVHTTYVDFSGLDWYDPRGVISTTIYDFDHDEADELLICYTDLCEDGCVDDNDWLISGRNMDYYHIVMDVFEYENGKAYKADGMNIGPYYSPEDRSSGVWNGMNSGTSGYIHLCKAFHQSGEISASVIDDSDRCLIAFESEWYGGVFSDFYSGNVWCLKYNDGDLQYACSYTQVAGGSDGFAYMGYVFGEDQSINGQLYYAWYPEDFSSTPLYDDSAEAIISFFSQMGIDIGVDTIYISILDSNNPIPIFALKNEVLESDYDNDDGITASYQATLTSELE